MLHGYSPSFISSSRSLSAINSASGYLALGMTDAARHELDSLRDREQIDPLALRIRVRIHLYEGDWEAAERIARVAAFLHPADHEFVVQRIFALYQMDRPKCARRLLRRSPRWLHNSGLLHYNLACYESLIGDEATARECAKAAFTLNPALKIRAQRDPDLRGTVGFRRRKLRFGIATAPGLQADFATQFRT